MAKEILFTHSGEQLMADARRLLADIDTSLIEKGGDKLIADTVTNLNKIERILHKLDK